MTTAFAALTTFNAAGLAIAWKGWHANDWDMIVHTLGDVGDLGAHLAQGELTADATYTRTSLIDDHHSRRPVECV